MTTDLAVVEDGEVVDTAAPITLFGTHNPVEVVERASTIATALADVIKKRNLYKHIGQSDHVFVEGWTLLGSMLGVFAEVEWSRAIEGGWESRAVARTLAGRTVGAAESMCSRSESRWRQADDYAIRSMAQTRAVSKALRLPLGFIMELAGYSATPAEEIPAERASRARPNEPAEPEGAGASVEAPASAPTSPQDGLPDMPDPTAAPDIAARYAWADRLGWDAIRLDEAAVKATEQTVMGMDREQWQAFALVVKAGSLNPPPKPGTDGYKRLLPADKASARAYWQKEAVAP